MADLDAPLVDEVTALIALEQDTLLATLRTGPVAMLATLEADAQLTATLAEVQAMRGPPGPPGPDANTLTKLSTGPLSALRVVRASDDAHVVPVSPLVRADAYGLIGVTRTSASAAEEVVFVVGIGEIADASWSFTPLRSVFVGEGGEVTQTLDPSWEWACNVGVAMSPTRVWVRVQAPTFVAREGG